MIVETTGRPIRDINRDIRQGSMLILSVFCSVGPSGVRTTAANV
jgi:hypothetical protein